MSQENWAERLDELRLCLDLLAAPQPPQSLAELERAAQLLEWIAESPEAYLAALSGRSEGAGDWLELSSKGLLVLGRALDASGQAIAAGEPHEAREFDRMGTRVLEALSAISAPPVTGLKVAS